MSHAPTRAARVSRQKSVRRESLPLALYKPKPAPRCVTPELGKSVQDLSMTRTQSIASGLSSNYPLTLSLSSIPQSVELTRRRHFSSDQSKLSLPQSNKLPATSDEAAEDDLTNSLPTTFLCKGDIQPLPLSVKLRAVTPKSVRRVVKEPAPAPPSYKAPPVRQMALRIDPKNYHGSALVWDAAATPEEEIFGELFGL